LENLNDDCEICQAAMIIKWALIQSFIYLSIYFYSCCRNFKDYHYKLRTNNDDI